MEFPSLSAVEKQEIYHQLNGKQGSSKASKLAKALKGKVSKKKANHYQMSARGQE